LQSVLTRGAGRAPTALTMPASRTQAVKAAEGKLSDLAIDRSENRRWMEGGNDKGSQLGLDGRCWTRDPNLGRSSILPLWRP